MSTFADSGAVPPGTDAAATARDGAGEPVVQAGSVAAGYGATKIIESVDLRLDPGQVVLIAGPNGAGKSTLVKVLVGDLPCLAGRVKILGRDTTGWSTAKLARLGVGYVPQNDHIFLPLTIKENLLLGGYLLKPKDRRDRVDVLLDLFPALGAARRRAAATLSGGQRKLLALARALMLEPRVIVLDEPTAGLSPKAAGALLEEHIGKLPESGRSILMVEQRVKDALRIADWIYVLVEGRVALSESAAAFQERPDAGRWLMGAASSIKRADRPSRTAG
jgi:branched-chain amino acid transport system ATP-binding protein